MHELIAQDVKSVHNDAEQHVDFIVGECRIGASLAVSERALPIIVAGALGLPERAEHPVVVDEQANEL